MDHQPGEFLLGDHLQGCAEEGTRESLMMGQGSLHPQEPKAGESGGEGVLGRHPRVFPPREMAEVASPPAHPSP